MNKEKTGVLTGLSGKDRILFPLICLATALIPLLYPAIANGGFYFICDDFNNQMLPFLYNFRDAFANGLNTYYWNYDLGTPMLYAYGYYGLGSIFYYPVFLVPKALFPYLILVIMLLKYMVACYTSFLFIKRFTKDAKAAIPGAILYGFSGLQCTNIVFYCFHDVSALFPLMVLALDALMNAGEKKEALRKGVLFSLAVAINCLTNYVFFVQSVAAIVIYFLFMSEKKPAEFFTGAVRSVVYGLLGVGLSGFLYIPSILYIMENERSSIGISSNLFLYDKKTLLYILKGFLLPGDIMLDESCLLQTVWLSTSCYLPLVGMALVIAYLMKKRDKMAALIAFLAVISFIPIGNGYFLLFTIIYHRWWYFLILLMAAVSSKVLEEPDEYRISMGCIIQAALIAVMSVLIFLIRDENGESLIFHKGRLLILIAIALLGTALVYVFDLFRRLGKAGLEAFGKIMLLGIMFFAIITTLYAEKFYRAASPVEPSDYINIYEAGAKLPDPGEQYRFRNYRNPIVMYNPSENAAGLSSYSSTTSNSIIWFDELFDWWDVSRRTNKNFLPGVPELLGGKYLILTDADTEERYPDYIVEMDNDPSVSPIDSFDVGEKNYRIYEMDACPIGYAVDSYITEDELSSIPKDMRGIALLHTVVVDEYDGALVSGLLDKTTPEAVMSIIEKDASHTKGEALFQNSCIKDAVEKNTAASLEHFERDHSGFRGDCNYSKDSVIYFTIPYDEGWKVTVDGKKTELISSGGMSLLLVDAGPHHIEATYHVPGLLAGIIATIICASALIILSVISKSR